MLYIALGFPKGNRVTDHYSILVPKVVGFPPRFAVTISSMKVLNKWRNLVSLVYSVFLVSISKKYYLYELEICNHKCAQHFT